MRFGVIGVAGFCVVATLLLAIESRAQGYVSFTVLGQSPTSVQVKTSERIVIESEDEWKSFYRSATQHILPPPPIPAIDFKSQTVLVATAGTKSSVGYDIMIKGVFEGMEIVDVQVLEINRSTCGNLQALTYPSTIITVPKIGKPFRFRTKEATFECGK